MERYNPWWRGEEDPFLSEWRKYEVKWIPKEVEKFSLKPFSLNFLIGPRQVGKTTALKILINKLLREGRDPKSLFYFACDELLDYIELGEILDSYLSSREKWGVRSSLIVLDEVTFVEDWWRAVKSRIDRLELRKDILIITGSASIELLTQKELFPGRRGYGRDIYMHPMSFGDYVENFGGIKLRRSDINGIWECVKANSMYSNTIRRLFKDYLLSGGFPLPIRELRERGRISYGVEKAYLDWLRADWSRVGKSQAFMKEVISYILSSRLSPISWNGLAKNTSIASPNTARSYIETLEALLVAKVLHFISPDGRVWYRKNKKVHFMDPFIYRVFSSYTGVKVLEETIVESLLVSHLARFGDVFYWRNGSEVDAIIASNGMLGFEVKWGPISWRRPKWLKSHLLDEERLPVFLGSLLS